MADWLGGVAGGLDALQQLLVQRKLEKLKADAVAEQIRQFNVRTEETAREHRMREQERIDALAQQKQIRDDTLAWQKQQQQNVLAKSVVEGGTPPEQDIGPEAAGAVRSLFGGGVLRTTAASPGGPPQSMAPGMLSPPVEGTLAALPGGLMPNPSRPETNVLPAGGYGYQEKRQAAQEKQDEAQLKIDLNRANKPVSQPVMRVNPKTGQMEQLGTAPAGAHFVQEPTPAPQTPHFTTQPEIGPDNKPTGRHFKINGLTGEISLTQTPAGGALTKPGMNAVTANRVESAKAAMQTGEDLIQAMSDPRVRAALGPVAGRATTVEQFIGNLPPEYAQLAGAVESFTLANMGVHGMRSVQGAQQLKALLAPRMTPEAFAAAVRGISQFSKHLIENQGLAAPGTASPGGAPSSGGSRQYYDSQGNPISR